jgi:NAD(P)H-dependent FMN reductase
MTQQQQPRIGIVIGSTREGRFGEKPAHWIHEIAKQRTDLAFELVDLRDHPLPFFNEPRSPAYGPVNNEAARLWAARLATLDGLIVVTPAYNHGPSAVLKNALDYAYREFARKPIGFVGYGGVGGIPRYHAAGQDLRRLSAPGAGGPQAARRHVMVGQGAEAGTQRYDARRRRPRASREIRHRHGLN